MTAPEHTTHAPDTGFEEQRLAALARCGLDASSETRFDRLTELIASVLEVPIALISIVGDNQQWFKACVGFDQPSTSRDVSFCRHLVTEQAPDSLVIADALEDPRFATNPLVTGSPGIRFYAGHVVRSPDGVPIGTVCAIDRRTRILDDRQRSFLRIAAELAESEIARSAELATLKLAAQQRLVDTAVLEQLVEGVVVWDGERRVHSANSAALALLGLSRRQLEGLDQFPTGWIVRRADGSDEAAVLPSEMVRRTGQPHSAELVVERGDGDPIAMRAHARPLTSDDGAQFVVSVFTDITEIRRSEHLLDLTFEIAPVGLAIIDRDRAIVRCNTEFVRQSGRPPDQLHGADVVGLLSPASRRAAASVGDALRDQRLERGSLEQLVNRPDGQELWVRTHLAASGRSEFPMAVAATTDVTEMRQLLESLRRFEHLFERAHDLIVILDRVGQIAYANPTFTRLLGWALDSPPPQGWASLIHEADVTAASAALVHALGHRPVSGELRVRTRTGELRHLHCVITDMTDEPSVNGLVVVARDDTERAELTSQLNHHATHDALTGLANRRLFYDRLDAALAGCGHVGGRVAVCYIDLDRFKAVNDQLGHSEGDALLLAVAVVMTAAVREGDVVARIGGDEFALVFESVADERDAWRRARRVQRRINESLSGRRAPAVGVSIGITVAIAGDTADEMLQRADAALYRAKSGGGGTLELAGTHELAG